MFALLPGGSPAAEAVSLEGKTVTIVIGSSPGGTTDASARLMASGLSKHLPGKPAVVVQSKPGAHSLTAMNYFAEQVKPDGLTLAVGSGSQIDPINYRIPASRYDPTKFHMVGGVDLGGGIVIIRNEALPRLKDKTKASVIMGSPSGLPHSTMMPAAWGIDYLGWNVRWVTGYPSNSAALFLALERGEIDIVAFSTSGLPNTLFDRDKFTIIYQTGSNRCHTPSSLPQLKDVPIFGEAMQGKISDPLAQRAFDYWCNGSSIATWLALPPGTPAAIVDAYRAAFAKAVADPAFLEQGRSYAQDFSPVSFEDVTEAARSYGQVSPEVVDVLPQMLRKQGLILN
jgi:tripartite-type tricarboxylate transporter receptor subunit TctC